MSKSATVVSEERQVSVGIRTLRSLRVSSAAANTKPSERLQKKIDTTYDYFLQEVDPVIGACITHLLCTQPVDVAASMLAYLRQMELQKAEAAAEGGAAAGAAAAAAGGVLGSSSAPTSPTKEANSSSSSSSSSGGNKENKRPKKEQKLYLAMSIGPVVAKLVNRIAISRPKNVASFMVHELGVMIYGSQLAGGGGEESNWDQVDERFAMYEGQDGPKSPAAKKKAYAAASAEFAKKGPNEEGIVETMFEDGPPAPSRPGTAPAGAAAPETNTPQLDEAEILSPAVQIRNVQIAMLGMDAAGKSSVINMLQGNFEAKVRPTIGFRPVSMMLGEETRVRFYDLGGGEKIREIWAQYYHDVHAVVYVFDASADPERWDSSVALFKSTIQHTYLAGKPLLILANKQDAEGAREEQMVAELLNVAEAQGTKVLACSSLAKKQEAPAVEGEEGGEQEAATYTVDPRIESSLEWLLDVVQGQFDSLNERVEIDTKRKAQEEAKQRLARERKVLRNKIACAFPDRIDPANAPEVGSTNPEDAFTAEEAKTFLAAEIGDESLPDIGVELAAMVGHQRLALQIIGALKAPISKKKDPMSWEEIRALVVELRVELGLPEKDA